MTAAAAVQLLTVRDVAGRLALSQRTVQGYIARGELRVVRFGRAVRVTERELAVFIANRERAGRRA